MANKEHRYYDDEERGSKNFGDYDYSKKTLRATDKCRLIHFVVGLGHEKFCPNRINCLILVGFPLARYGVGENRNHARKDDNSRWRS